MKTYFTKFRFRFSRSVAFLFFLLLPLLFFAQNSAYRNINLHLNNWKALHAQNKYDLAAEQAERAFLLAKKSSDKLMMAIALNREGQSYSKMTSRTRKNRRTAKEKFENSLVQILNTEYYDLKINNLKGLQLLAKLNDDKEGAAIYKGQISAINKLRSAKATNEILSNQIDTLDTQKMELSQEKMELSQEKMELSQEKIELSQQKFALSKKVESLVDSQLRAELIISLQKSQVDSLHFESTKDSFQLDLQANQIELQQNQIDLQRSQRNFFLALAALVGLLAVGFIIRFLQAKKHAAALEQKNEIIEAEQKKSEELLLNILPAVVANELKINGSTKARKYENATVFFSDFENFSAIAEKSTPEQLVRELDFYFKTFDKIIERHDLEKIKTIGDSYMCVGGLPGERDNHPRTVINAALEIQEFLEKHKSEKLAKGEIFFEARIGIHTGPLVAGVVGSTKFAFDIWGDTVNVASRLETSGRIGKVNISNTTFQMVKEEYECTFRGQLPIKNRGEVRMYFVDRKK